MNPPDWLRYAGRPSCRISPRHDLSMQPSPDRRASPDSGGGFSKARPTGYANPSSLVPRSDTTFKTHLPTNGRVHARWLGRASQRSRTLGVPRLGGLWSLARRAISGARHSMSARRAGSFEGSAPEHAPAFSSDGQQLALREKRHRRRDSAWLAADSRGPTGLAFYLQVFLLAGPLHLFEQHSLSKSQDAFFARKLQTPPDSPPPPLSHALLTKNSLASRAWTRPKP